MDSCTIGHFNVYRGFFSSRIMQNSIKLHEFQSPNGNLWDAVIDPSFDFKEADYAAAFPLCSRLLSGISFIFEIA